MSTNANEFVFQSLGEGVYQCKEGFTVRRTDYHEWVAERDGKVLIKPMRSRISAYVEALVTLKLPLPDWVVPGSELVRNVSRGT